MRGCYKFLLVLFLALSVSACGGYGSTKLVAPVTGVARSAEISVTHIKSDVEVPPNILSTFESRLNDSIYKDAGFQQGDGVKLEWSFVNFTKGSRAARYFMGGFGQTGAGKLKVRARFLDTKGIQLSVIESEGVVAGGFFGGSYGTAIKEAVREISAYAVKNYGVGK
tara:strand:- start:3908 stop:4408 length:501 start_codon:yes stop_codon:yes gene_type:complete